jgi:hypothetical protein
MSFDASAVPSNPHDLDDLDELDARGRIYTLCRRLKAFWK